MSLRDKTPAQVAGIKFPLRNWKDLTEQPYRITAKIDLDAPRVMLQHKPKIIKRRRHTKRKISKSKSTPTLTSVKLK